MRKPAAVLFAILVGGLIWFFFQHFQVEGVDAVRVVPKDPNADAKYRDDRPGTTPYAMKATSRAANWLGSQLGSPPASGRDTIRVASFHLESFGQAHVAKQHVMDLVARIVRQFDVVALQGITSPSDDVVPRMVDLLNRTGRRYDYVVGPRLGARELTQQYAFVFDRDTLLLERDELYTVGDPHDLLSREPLVAWFRAIGPAQDEAFTFTVVNVLTDARRNEQELNVLDNVFVEVQNDGRGEDDVIMLGDLNADPRALGELGQMAGMVWAVRGVPTNVEGTRQTQHIMFQRSATDEFTGRWGVCDFLREFNLSVEGARETSPHLPVWAEFAKYEGGDQGRVASRGGKSVP